MSGITTIVISSTAARPPMPLRRATSPSKCVGLTLVGSIDGADSLKVPVAGARCASGSDAPVSSILISFDCALTLVARLLRPFLSREAGELLLLGAGVDLDRVGLVGAVAGGGLLGDLDLDVVAAGLERDRAVGLDRRRRDAAGSAARAAAPEPLEPPSSPTRTIQHRLPPFWKNP